MNIKKIMLLGFLIFIPTTVTILAIFAGNYIWQKKELKEAMNQFSKIIESGNIDDLSLTISCVSPSRDTPYPYRVDHVIKFGGQIVIGGNDLKDHIDLLDQISSTNIVPVWKKSYLDARIYYVFETGENGKIFDVAMWSGNNNVFVSGIEVKPNDIYYDVIMPFLPEGMVTRLEIYLGVTKE